jgi:hypothetical protein
MSYFARPDVRDLSAQVGEVCGSFDRLTKGGEGGRVSQDWEKLVAYLINYLFQVVLELDSSCLRYNSLFLYRKPDYWLHY